MKLFDLHYRSYTVSVLDFDATGVTIDRDQLLVLSGTITDTNGNDADLSHPPAMTGGPSVDGKVPGVKQVTISPVPASRRAWSAGDDITVMVLVDKPYVMSQDTVLSIGLIVGDSGTDLDSRTAPCDAHSSILLRCVYTVTAADLDDTGITVPANSLVNTSGRLTDKAGNTFDVSHLAVLGSIYHRVAGSQVTTISIDKSTTPATVLPVSIPAQTQLTDTQVEDVLVRVKKNVIDKLNHGGMTVTVDDVVVSVKSRTLRRALMVSAKEEENKIGCPFFTRTSCTFTSHQAAS